MSGYKDLALLNQALGGLDASLTQNQALGFNQKNSLAQLAMQRKQQELSQANTEDMMRYRREALAREHAWRMAQSKKDGTQDWLRYQSTRQDVAGLVGQPNPYSKEHEKITDMAHAWDAADKAGQINPEIKNFMARNSLGIGGVYQETPEPPGTGWFDKLFSGVEKQPEPSPFGTGMGPTPSPIPSSFEKPDLSPGLFPLQTDQPLWMGPPVVKSKVGALGGKKPALNSDAGSRRTYRTLGK